MFEKNKMSDMMFRCMRDDGLSQRREADYVITMLCTHQIGSLQ